MLGLVPPCYDTYIEPFVGGASIFLILKPKNAIINDFEQDLFNFNTNIKTNLNNILSLYMIMQILLRKISIMKQKRKCFK